LCPVQALLIDERIQECGSIVQLRVLWPAEKLFQVSTLPLQTHHFRADGYNALAKNLVAAAHCVNVQTQAKEKQSRNDTQDARARKEFAVRLKRLRR
jgi:hypothetical protein